MPPTHRHARTYLVNPRFQLKYTGLLVAVVVSLMAVLGVIVGRTASTASDYAQLAVAESERAMSESRANSALARQNVQLAAADNPELAKLMEEGLAEADQKAERDVRDVLARKAEIERLRTRLLVLLVVSGLALTVLLGAMGILITHRVVGPVHKIKRLLRQVGTGRLTVKERLRQGDELSDLFDTFLQMTFSLRALQAGRLATLEATLRQAEAAGTSPEVIQGLRALRAQLLLGLGVEAAVKRASIARTPAAEIAR